MCGPHIVGRSAAQACFYSAVLVSVCSLGPPPAPSRGLHRYYDSDDVISDYSQELKEYGGGAAGAFEPDHQHRSYRSSGERSPSLHGCRNGRYGSPGTTHDEVFLDSKGGPEWDSGSRSGGGYRSSDDRTSTRSGGPHGHSPSESRVGSGASRSARTSQSISPVRRRHGKEHSGRVMSPPASSRDHDRRHDDRAASRRSSLESPDRERYPSSRASDVGRTWSHGGGGGDCVKSSRTVANDLDGDTASSNVLDRDRLSSRTSDRSSSLHRAVACDVNRRHGGDKDAPRSTVLRSVVNTTPSWRYDSEHKHPTSRSGGGSDHTSSSEPFVVDSNHIGMALQKLRSETIEIASDATTASPQSKSPRAGSDVEEESTPQLDRPPSKGGSDDMLHLEKEKSHLLNMLKELEDYSSGGSEMEGLDEESRAALRRLHRQRDELADTDCVIINDEANHGLDGTEQLPAAAAGHARDQDLPKSTGEPKTGAGRSDSRRSSETCRRWSANSSDAAAAAKKARRASLENHVGPVIASSLDAEENIIDLIGSSPPAEIPAEFTTRRQRTCSDITSAAVGGRLVKPRRSYRPRDSAGDSAESGPEDGHSSAAAKSTASRQPNDHASTAVQPEVPPASSGSATTPVVHRTHSLDDVSATSRRSSATGGPSRKSSGSDHQPCIIPDSPVTTRGPDTRLPTEPRTLSLTTTAGGRTIMDLPLPRFGFERNRMRNLSSSSSTATSVEQTTCSASTSARVESAAIPATTVTVKTDIAPFSPGLLSPAMSPLASRIDTTSTTPTVSTVTSGSVSAQTAAGKDKTTENEIQSSLTVSAADAVTSEDAVQKETPSVEPAAIKTDASSEEVDIPVASDEVTLEDSDSAGTKMEPKLESESEKPSADGGKEAAAIVTTALSVSGTTTAKEETTSMSLSADSDVSDLLSPGSPPDNLSLEARIQALDEKLNQIQKTTPRHLPSSDSGGLPSSTFDYSRFIRRRKPPITPTTAGVECSAASEPSDYVKSLLSRTSIFDQDSRRLEQLQSKVDPTVSASVAESGTSSSLVSRMRYAGRLPPHELSLQLPLSTSSLHVSPYPSSLASGYRSSDLSMPLSSPGGSYCGRAGSSLMTPPPSTWGTSAVTAGWTPSWTGQSSVSMQLSAPPMALSTPDSAVLRSSGYLPYGTPQTPSAVSSSSAPTDPRRAPRSSAEIFPSPLSIRRQDSCHSSSDTSSEAWALNSAVRREPEVSTVPGKPKEMVSPPVSILKKTSTSSLPKDDLACISTKSGDTSIPSGADTSSAGVKRTADTAFGKEPSLSTPNKIVARTPKSVSQPSTVYEAESHATKSAESDQQKTQTNVHKRSEPIKKPLQLKPSVTKVEDKKTDHGMSGTMTSGRKTAEDASKTGSSVKTQNKPHSTASTSLSTSSASAASKSHTPKDQKPASNTDSSRHTAGPKESSGHDNDLSDKHGSSHTSSSSGKLKTSHSASRELTTKDRSADDRDRLTTSDEKESTGKEKTTLHGSSKHHQSEHRQSDKTSRDGKPEDSGKTSSKISSLSSASKTAPKTVARDSTKPDRFDKNLHSKPKSDTSNSVKKEGLESGKKDAAGPPKTSSSNKSERDHKSEKDELNRVKTSPSNLHSKPTKKPGGDSFPTIKPSSSSSKPASSSSSKTKHTEKSSGDRKSEAKKAERSQPDKSKKQETSTSDKNKSAKKKSEKRPEEKREVCLCNR